jgi:hypothetical protein
MSLGATVPDIGLSTVIRRYGYTGRHNTITAQTQEAQARGRNTTTLGTVDVLLLTATFDVGLRLFLQYNIEYKRGDGSIRSTSVC